MNNQLFYKVMLVTSMIHPLCAVNDYVQGLGAAAVIVASAVVGVIIDRNCSERSIKHQQDMLALDKQRSIQQQEHDQEKRIRHSQQTLKRCSNRYKDSNDFNSQAHRTGKALYQVINDAIADRELLLEAHIYLEPASQEDCARLVTVISNQLSHSSTHDKHLIEQSKNELEALQNKENDRNYEQQKRELEINKLRILTEQEQAKLSLIVAQVTTQHSTQQAYETLVPVLNNKVENIVRCIESLTHDSNTLKAYIHQEFKQLNDQAKNTTHDIHRISQMQSALLHLLQAYLITIVAPYHTNQTRLSTIALQDLDSLLRNVGFYNQYADHHFNPAATAPEHS